VAVGIAEVNPSAPLARVQLPILQAPRVAAIGNSGFLYALKNSIEVKIVHVKRIVVDFERLRVVEVESKILVDSNWREVAHGAIISETEDPRKNVRTPPYRAPARWCDLILSPCFASCESLIRLTLSLTQLFAVGGSS